MQLSETFKTGLVEFIRCTSTELPNDIIRALMRAQDQEAPISTAANALKTICIILSYRSKARRRFTSFFVRVSYMCWADRRRTMKSYDGRMEID